MQRQYALPHKKVTVVAEGESNRIRVDIAPDEYEPYAVLSAKEVFGEQLASVEVRPDFKLNTASANAWSEGGCRAPR